MNQRLYELAASLLARSGLPQLRLARQEHERAVAQLEAELAVAEHNVSIWDRAWFFQNSPDQAEVARIGKALEQAYAKLDQSSAECDQVARQVWVQCPPVEIAHRVEGVIARALADGRVGRDRGRSEVADELDALADRVFELWAPGVQTDRVAQALLDDGWRAERAATSAGAPRAHETLAWCPINEDEFAARAAVALESGGIHEARAALQKEASEYEAMAARLEAARRQLDGAGSDDPARTQQHWQLVAWLTTAADKEQRDVVAAAENELHAVELAFGAYPPLAIGVAARTAAGALWAQSARVVFEHGMDGTRHVTTPGYMRAFFLAALVELRRVTEAALPGLPELVSSRVARAAAVRPASEEAFVAAMEHTAARALVRGATAHATMHGAIEQALRDASKKVGWLESLVFFSRSEDKERVARLEQRRNWHRQVIRTLGDQLTHAVIQAAAGQPLLQTSMLVAGAHWALSCIHTGEPPMTLNPECPLHGIPAALHAIDQLGLHLSKLFGLVGGRAELIDKLVEALAGAPREMPPRVCEPVAYAELVAGLAAYLRGYDFVAETERVQALAAEVARAQRSLSETPLPMWQIGVWLNSEVEREYHKQRTDHYRRSSHHRAKVHAVGQQVERVNALLNRALAWYPPAELYYNLLDVRLQVSMIRAEYSQGHYDNGIEIEPRGCKLHGRDEAAASLRHWTQHAIRVFGPLPTPSDLLERWVQSELA